MIRIRDWNTHSSSFQADSSTTRGHIIRQFCFVIKSFLFTLHSCSALLSKISGQPEKEKEWERGRLYSLGVCVCSRVLLVEVCAVVAVVAVVVASQLVKMT